MKSCGQTEKQSVLQHGFFVKNYLFDLLDHLEHSGDLKYEWRIPDWVYENRDSILRSLPDRETLKLYTIFHDCGKPFCITFDADGKRHFPDHSKVSYEVFKDHFNNDTAAELILHDMDIHTLKSEGVEEFSKNPHAITLLITGLAETHSNAAMFGGMDSTSFKIKYKSICQRGKQIINILKQKK